MKIMRKGLDVVVPMAFKLASSHRVPLAGVDWCGSFDTSLSNCSVVVPQEESSQKSENKVVAVVTKIDDGNLK